jgi:hypothetical protein
MPSKKQTDARMRLAKASKAASRERDEMIRKGKKPPKFSELVKKNIKKGGKK